MSEVSSESRGAANAPPIVEYVTRFIPTPNLTSTRVLPYVEQAIRTLGYGSAVPFGEEGIQITVPTQLMSFLESTINAYERNSAQFRDFEERKFYPPAIRVKTAGAALMDLVEILGLCPPDMRVAWISLGDAGALLVSGPSRREPHFLSTVLPSLKTLASQFSSGFAHPPR